MPAGPYPANLRLIDAAALSRQVDCRLACCRAMCELWTQMEHVERIELPHISFAEKRLSTWLNVRMVANPRLELGTVALSRRSSKPIEVAGQNGGRSGIRTHGPFRVCCFQDSRIKPDSATLPNGAQRGILTLIPWFEATYPIQLDESSKWSRER